MMETNPQHTEFIYPSASRIAGVDEVGRGPLCGDVVTAAVILDRTRPIPGLTDSKKLTEKKRRYFFDLITEQALCFCIGRATVFEIDTLNILQATLLAMQRAIEGLTCTPDWVLVDGHHTPKIAMPVQGIVKGDLLVPEISAASILAKVTRDQDMVELDAHYPHYGLAQHKGYPTAAHLDAIKRYGVTEHYRRSFGPVKAAMHIPVKTPK